jgi:acetyl esterase
MADLNETTGMPARAADDLDPEIRHFVAQVAADLAPYPELQSVPLAEARRILETVRARWTLGGPRMAETSERDVPARGEMVRVRVHKPLTDGGASPALVYLHGGGWTYFSLDTHDRLMREYAGRADMIVVGVDYALSPEAKFPVALEQVIEVVQWLHAAGPELGIDPGRIAIGGDSAGANLAISSCIALRETGKEDLIRAAVLNYGAFEARCPAETPSPFGGPGYMLGEEEMQNYWANYVRSEADLDSPLVCPLRADLSRLPPAMLVIPECDVLAWQGHEMAARLRQAGVPVKDAVYHGATHSFLEAASIAALSRRALADTADWLKKTLAGNSGRPMA